MGKSEYLKNCSQSSELTFKRHLRQNTSVKPAVLQRDGRQRQEIQVNIPKQDILEYTASQQKQERPWLEEMGGETCTHLCTGAKLTKLQMSFALKNSSCSTITKVGKYRFRSASIF